jgi:hypothetical protein
MNFEEMSEVVGINGFTAEIQDGKFVISPADAGVALFAFVQTNNERLDAADAVIEELNNLVEELREDNAGLRDLLERVYGVLLDAGYPDLADEVITAAYPVKGIEERK